MTIPGYFLGDNKHNHKKKSVKQETRVAKKMGGKVQSGSGAVAHRRGDVTVKEMLIECKRTDRAGISLRRDWIEKITKEATSINKIPAVSLEFGIKEEDKKRVSFPIEKDWMAVPMSFFEELIALYRDEK